MSDKKCLFNKSVIKNNVLVTSVKQNECIINGWQEIEI